MKNWCTIEQLPHAIHVFWNHIPIASERGILLRLQTQLRIFLKRFFHRQPYHEDQKTETQQHQEK